MTDKQAVQMLYALKRPDGTLNESTISPDENDPRRARYPGYSVVPVSVIPRITREALRAEWNRVAASDGFPAPADWNVEHAIAALKRLGVPVGE